MMSGPGHDQDMKSYLLVDYGLDQQRVSFDSHLSKSAASVSVAFLFFVLAYAFSFDFDL